MEEVVQIQGGQRLLGEVTIQGSKNASLPILSACILNGGQNILHGIPRIEDVEKMLTILQAMGASVKWEEKTLLLDTGNMKGKPVMEHAGSMRSSLMLLGSLTSRFGEAVLGYPGGCCIGERPIDLHEKALEAMGCIFYNETSYYRAVAKDLTGADIILPFPSVGVTENVILSGVMASGVTRLNGAAREPEIVELCRALKTMGAKITGEGTDKIIIKGTKSLSPVEYHICSDRIVAGTYMMVLVGTGGEITLHKAPLEHMKSVLEILIKMGALIRRDRDCVHMLMKNRPRAIEKIVTAPYPGFPTDLQSSLMCALCLGDGDSMIEERIFENRYLMALELLKMGGSIQICERFAKIKGARKLHGAQVRAEDLRGGAALFGAGAMADGITRIENAGIVKRGYENITGDLKSLGVMLY